MGLTVRLVCEGAVGCMKPVSLLEGLDLHPTWQACLGHGPEACRLSPQISVSVLLNSPGFAVTLRAVDPGEEKGGHSETILGVAVLAIPGISSPPERSTLGCSW